jgi:hypothetical protein
MQLTVGYVQADKDSCNGSFVSTTCNITEAVVEYSVEMSGQTVTLNNISPRLNVVALPNDQAPGTLAGLYFMGQSLFESNVTWQFAVQTSYTITNLDIFPSQYLVAGNASNPEFCLGNLTWADPTNDILTAFNEIMFRTAIQAAVNTTSTYNLQSPNGGANKTFSSATTVNGTQILSRNVFLTRFTYLIAAAVVMTVAILAVVPTFYGWWQLGRAVSLNPIETAKAFDAPILGGSAALSNAEVYTLVKNIEKRGIVYGEILQADGKGERKLTIGTLGPRAVS